MDFTMEDVPSVPPGQYVARFLGCQPQDAKGGAVPQVTGRDGKPLPYGVVWAWEVVEGEYRGWVIDRLTGKVPTARSTCGAMIQAITGQPFEAGKTVKVNTLTGTMWRIVVEKKESGRGTRVAVYGLARAYDLEPRSAASAATAEAGPPPDDFGPPDDAGNPAVFWVKGFTDGSPPKLLTNVEVLAGIKIGLIVRKSRLNPAGTPVWFQADSIFHDPKVWGTDPEPDDV